MKFFFTLLFSVNLFCFVVSAKDISKLEENGQHAEALEIALSGLKETKDTLQKIDLNKKISIIYFKRNKQQQSLNYINNAIALAVQLKNDTIKAKLFNNKGIIYSLNANHDSSLFYYQKAVILKTKIKDSKGIYSTFNNIGVIYEQKNNIDTAIYYYNKALKIQLKEEVKTNLSKSYNNIGLLFHSIALYDSAEVYFFKAKEYTKYNSDPNLLAKINMNLRDLFLEKKDYKKAIYYSRIFHHQKDSLYNAETSSKISELEVRYETEKQKHVINIQEEKLKKRAVKLRYGTIIIILMSLIIIGSIYYNYRLRQKSNLLQKVRKQAFLNYIKGQETERMRIAFHLHDDLNNTLMSAKITEEKDRYVLEALEILNSATTKVFSESIRAFGINKALINYIVKLRQKKQLVYYSTNIDNKRFPVWIEASIYRIVIGLIECIIPKQVNEMHLYLTWNKLKLEIDVITEKNRPNIESLNPIAGSLLTVMGAEIIIGEETLSIEIPLKEENLENELANS